MIESKNGCSLRHELKFRINKGQSQILQKRFAATLKTDPHMEPNGRYRVSSLYFDDVINSALKEKESGVYRRSKYRIRIYNNSDKKIKFERKTKIGDYNLKEAAELTRGEAERIIAGDIGFLADSKYRLLREFYLESRQKILRPVVFVEYDRVAYIHPVGNVRITFDTGLCTSLGQTSFFESKTSKMGVVGEDNVIMEVKYNDVIPEFIRGLFLDTIQLRTGISKFELCRRQEIARTGNYASILTCVCTRARDNFFDYNKDEVRASPFIEEWAYSVSCSRVSVLTSQ
jgi:hypothetical protein